MKGKGQGHVRKHNPHQSALLQKPTATRYRDNRVKASENTVIHHVCGFYGINNNKKNVMFPNSPLKNEGR